MAKEYIRLPGTGQKTVGGFVGAGRFRLWLGRDHLLQTSNQYFNETCKRFYYKDIQAITVEKTRKGWIINLVCGIITLLLGLAAASGNMMDGNPISTGRDVLVGLSIVVAFIFLLIVIINTLMGPTSLCRLQTAVQIEELSSLNRLWRARRVLRRIRPKIVEAQGELVAEQIQAAGEAIYGVGSRLSGQARIQGTTPPKAIKHETGRFHVALFILSLIDGAHSAINIFFANSLLHVVSGIILLGYLVFLPVTLVKQTGSDLPSLVKKLSWSSLACFTLLFCIAIPYGIMSAIDSKSGLGANVPSMNDPVLLAMSLFSMTYALAIGALGLLALKNRDVAPTPAAPPP